LAPRPCTCNAQRAAPRESAWHHDQIPPTHNECLHEQRPEHHDQVPFELNAGARNNWAKAHIHKSWARFLLNPPCSVEAFVVNSEPHTGARPLGPFVCGTRASSLRSYIHVRTSYDSPISKQKPVISLGPVLSDPKLYRNYSESTAQGTGWIALSQKLGVSLACSLLIFRCTVFGLMVGVGV
jgi:hypothetical protein